MPTNRNQSHSDGENPNKRMPGGPDIPSTFDLTDSRTDEERLKQETSFVELPDVADIPGQEKITSIGPLGEMADSTPSSDDEEGIENGKDLMEEDDEVEIVMGTEADVTEEDLILLGAKDKDMDGGEDEEVRNIMLDNTDEDGEPLNESVGMTGDDLDIPEADENEPAGDAMGQGDEENNYFSLGSDTNDNLEQPDR
jgi:hypothetical protein